MVGRSPSWDRCGTAGQICLSRGDPVGSWRSSVRSVIGTPWTPISRQSSQNAMPPPIDLHRSSISSLAYLFDTDAISAVLRPRPDLAVARRLRLGLPSNAAKTESRLSDGAGTLLSERGLVLLRDGASASLTQPDDAEDRILVSWKLTLDEGTSGLTE